jgi:hypothetical protein
MPPSGASRRKQSPWHHSVDHLPLLSITGTLYPSETPARAIAFGCVSVFHRFTAPGRKIFEALQQPDRDLIRVLLERFQGLACRGRLRFSRCRTHPKGHGGEKHALAEVGASLTPLDEAMADLPDVFYRRYMDDWIILEENRRALRRAVRRMHVVRAALNLRQHTDKTWIGRLSPGEARGSQEKRFDFLGIDFSRQGLCGLSAAPASRVREATAGPYDRM